MLIATDLDGTFLAGTTAQRQALYRWIDERPEVQLAYVTGRGLPLVRPLLDEPGLARPDYLICDVGATVTDGRGHPIEALQAPIEAAWPGEATVLAAMGDWPGLQRQEQPQARRCSFYCESAAVSERLHVAVAKLGLDLLYSAQRYLDVLPPGVNKGSTLRRLVQHLGLDPATVLVAGDTLNDLSMYQQGFHGVCVGQSEPALLEATRDLPHVLHATQAGCGGILEAIRQHPRRPQPA